MTGLRTKEAQAAQEEVGITPPNNFHPSLVCISDSGTRSRRSRQIVLKSSLFNFSGAQPVKHQRPAVGITLVVHVLWGTVLRCGHDTGASGRPVGDLHTMLRAHGQEGNYIKEDKIAVAELRLNHSPTLTPGVLWSWDAEAAPALPISPRGLLSMLWTVGMPR